MPAWGTHEDVVEDRPERPPAVIEVRLLPWRPRRRMPDPGIDLSGLSGASDDLVGGVVALVVGVLAALLGLIVLAGVVMLLELWLVGAVALLLLLARFVGLLPWAVFTGSGYEFYRWLPHAAARVRALNGSRHARFRWHWA
ncbi:hypothetical protein J1G42_14190 [Cellulomonas sp. zg-ZUI222]|uniref:hypothetical protein n=1 Tax=Cellulomonas wangleii TaxID=2816956 RepID=UPI001A952D29|nr:hypothetical protein [Cellulomonas wangleii]MBO0921973.1 hypothetical protein [Cellulomonas wangleii]